MSRPYRLPALAGALCLALPLLAGATPPPDAQVRKLICGGAYIVDLKLDFTDGGIDADVRASADLEPTAFSPPPPQPTYALYVDTVYRYSPATQPTSHWQQITDTTENGYPAQPVSKVNGGWKGPSCELKGVAIASVGCPNGTWVYETLERTWPGCGV
ncbi:hypothetical protein [Lysobacter enzymogenes]|uniref:hypothetical protein n=1 Tax=Lysobacter enzymogenes TaxID=69 RepID=UPI0009D3956B|nr:hypothetical protein [Lysobacter enzymogenes]UZW62544.1 hypothetical protein BV903_009750 [Lysobacter enzymogenes]